MIIKYVVVAVISVGLAQAVCVFNITFNLSSLALG